VRGRTHHLPMRRSRAPRRSAGDVPNLLIIGAAKSGTTSLHAYLGLHPEIFMSRQKELKFFNRDDWREQLGWYRRQFPEPAPVRGESSPTYTMHPWLPGVPERIREVSPDARLIYMVRDPVERLLAMYVELYALRIENRNLEGALVDYEDPGNRVVLSSRYAYQLERYRACFPPSQILVIDQHDLLAARKQTLRRAFEFVGVDPDFESPEFDAMHNVRTRKIRYNALGAWLHERGVMTRVREPTRRLPEPAREALKSVVANSVSTPKMPPALRTNLEAHLQPDADRLRELTGARFPHWSV
jgi:hypothetical protein